MQDNLGKSSYASLVGGNSALLLTEHSMTPFHSQTAQKNSALFLSSVLQFENSNDCIQCSITEQSTPFSISCR